MEIRNSKSAFTNLAFQNPKEVKASVLRDMLLEIKDLSTKEVDMSPNRFDSVSPVAELSADTFGSEKPIFHLGNGKPVFTITPTEDEEEAKNAPSTITTPEGTSNNSTLKPNGMRSRDSRESLIPERNKEVWWMILAQVTIPFLIAGLGMVGAGIVLDHVKEWVVFTKVPEFLILVTPLLGLKGNLEMTLASRLSTHANLGHLETNKNKWHICYGDLALTQVQAIVVGFLASIVAIIMGVAKSEDSFILQNAVLLCATSVLTAALTSLVLGVLMITVILLSKKFQLNPDNIATPIAASLGDITTLGLLAWLASMLYATMEEKRWLPLLIIGAYLLIIPVWVWVAYKNEFTRKVLITGWPPVLIAMLISSGGGFLLDLADARHAELGLALYQPVINGVGGNLVSVQASRIATSLHRDSVPGVLPGLPGVTVPIFNSPWTVFFKQGVHSVAAQVLLLIVIPGQLIFATVIRFVSGQDAQFSVVFILLYLAAALIQVFILLNIARNLINLFWTKKIDPDTSTIPFLTSLGDLIGTGLLFLVFEIISITGTHN